MKLKKLLEGVTEKRQLSETGVVNQSEVDWSTYYGKSNIDQKWKKTSDLVSDINAWISVAKKGFDEKDLKELGQVLKGMGISVEGMAKGKDPGGTSKYDAMSRRGGDSRSTLIQKQSGGLYS